MLSIFTLIQARLATLKNEDGATATEYAVLVTVIALALFATITAYMAFLNGKIGGVTW